MPCVTRFLEQRIKSLTDSDAYDVRQLAHGRSDELKAQICGQNYMAQIFFSQALLAKHNDQDPLPDLVLAMQAFRAAAGYHIMQQQGGGSDGKAPLPNGTALRDHLLRSLDEWRTPDQPSPLGRRWSQQQLAEYQWQTAFISTLFGLLMDDRRAVEKHMETAMELSEAMSTGYMRGEPGNER